MGRHELYYYKNIFPKLTPMPYVLTGIGSMCYSGISLAGVYFPELLTNVERLGGFKIEDFVYYHYESNLNINDYVTPMKGFEFILIPTKERSIVENIKYNLDYIDEGYFLEALEIYKLSPFFNYELLKEVSNCLGVNMVKVDYWLEECYGAIR